MPERKFDFKNIFRLSHLLKVPELVFAIIIVLIASYGGASCSDHYLGWVDASTYDHTDSDGVVDPAVRKITSAENLGVVTSYGFLFILILQIISIFAGERSPIMTLLIAFSGCVFYLAAGSNRIAHTCKRADEILCPADNTSCRDMKPTKMALGSMAIINGVLFLVDTIMAGLDVTNIN